MEDKEQDSKQCPHCGQTIKADAKKCRYCKKWLNENTKTFNNNLNKIKQNPATNITKSSKIMGWITFIIASVSFFIVIGVENTVLPKCDSQYAEEQVINIFKRNNYAYKELSNAGFVKNVYLSGMQPLSYDKSINKYTCKAKIVMEAIDIGFNPTIYRGRWINERERYGKAYCWSKYYIYKERGKDTVWAEYCSNGIDFEDYFYQ